MTNQTLKTYTIIPQHLYVNRDADRQLKTIIEDMGRPGYVLVSRQMGKTNLLLNAKRVLETPNDAYVYIDLSNSYEGVKDCFQSIIDSAIDIHYDKFHKVADTISIDRANKNQIPAHKQHISELRKLLNCIGGKLVIILDEIDALQRTEYSDQIFSQIRSIYFSRVNYPEFERLTYLLSGVIEPTELIKDPKISPFNIGQKIFLNDFSKEEYNDFIKKSGLTISDEIKDRIFYWTNGNPRLTWDVCAELETIIESKKLTPAIVDNTIYAHYLTNFDKPPIDNIRDIIQQDPELRDAVLELQKNKNASISDRTKHRLYLLGVVNYDIDKIQIKNNILKESLSIQWLQKVREEGSDQFDLAIDAFLNKDYTRAYEILIKHLEASQLNEDEKIEAYYQLAICAHEMGNYQESINYFIKTSSDENENPKRYYNSLMSLGLNYLKLKLYNNAIETYEKLLSKNRNDENYIKALINISYIYHGREDNKDMNRAIDYMSKVINPIVEYKITPERNEYYKCVANYHLHEYEMENGNRVNGIRYLKNALNYDNVNAKIVVLIALLENLESTTERINILNEIFRISTANEIKTQKYDEEEPLNLTEEHLHRLIYITYVEFRTKFNELIIESELIIPDSEKAIWLLNSAMYGLQNYKNNFDDGLSLLENLSYKKFNFNIPPEVSQEALKILCLNTPVNQSIKHHQNYATEIKNDISKIEEIDLHILADYTYELIRKSKYGTALSVIKLLEDNKQQINSSLYLSYLIFYNLQLNIYILQNNEQARQVAHKTLQIINSIDPINENSSLLGDTGLEIIKQNAIDYLSPNIKPNTPIRSSKKYSRNDTVKVKYRDGVVITTKFKKVSLDIQNGNCVVIN